MNTDRKDHTSHESEPKKNDHKTVSSQKKIVSREKCYLYLFNSSNRCTHCSLFRCPSLWQNLLHIGRQGFSAIATIHNVIAKKKIICRCHLLKESLKRNQSNKVTWISIRLNAFSRILLLVESISIICFASCKEWQKIPLRLSRKLSRIIEAYCISRSSNIESQILMNLSTLHAT